MRLTRNKLIRGEAIQVLRKIAPDSFDVGLVDPPYSSAVSNGFKVSTRFKYSDRADLYPEFAGDHRDQRSFQLWVTLWSAELFRVVRSGGGLLTFIDYRNICPMIDAIQAGGWTFRGVIPWIKNNSRPQRGWFRASGVEFVVLANKGNQSKVNAYGPSFVQGQPPSRNRKHANEKPAEILKDLIAWRPDWNKIIDPFVGSGSIFVAANRMKRVALGIEYTEHFANVARGRLREQ